MSYERENIERPFSASMLKGAGIAALCLAIKGLVALMTWLVWATEDSDSFPNALICVICFVASLIVYNSITSLLLSFDKGSYDEFTNGEKSRENGFLRVFGYKSVLYEFLGFIIVFSIVAVFGGFGEITGMFYYGEGRNPYRMGILPLLSAIVVGTLLYSYDRYETVRYWRYVKKTGRYEELESKSRIIFRMLFACLVYPIALPFLPALVYPIALAFGVIGAIIAELTVPGFILAVLLFIFAIWLFRFWRKSKKRKAFFKSLRDVCSLNNYRLSEIENPYISLITSRKKCRFTLEYKHFKFNCLVLSTPRYAVPICFDEPERGYYRYRLGTKRHNITLRRHFDYSLDGEGTKILIINPTPKHALICDEKKERRLFNADKIWDFVIYEAEAFVNSADRQVLGRFDTDRDNLSEAMVTKKITHLKRFQNR